jgi:hypothetical protein
MAPNGAVLGVTYIDGGQQGIEKPFLYHGISCKGVLLSATGGIFTATYELDTLSKANKLSLICSF